MNSYVQSVYEGLKQRNPYEKEFLQAAWEGIESRNVRAHAGVDDHETSSPITCAESPPITTERSRISSGTGNDSMFRQA